MFSIKDKFYDNISKSVILLFFMVFLILATLTPTKPVGESDDYMLATISLENRCSLFFTEEDVAQAKIDFPEHYEYIHKTFFAYNDDDSMYTTADGKNHCYYFGTYSFLCIFAKEFLKILGLRQSYAFAITNVLLYVLALTVVFKKLKLSRKNVFLTIILLACAPTVAYYFWPSAEICIFSFVVMALVYYINKDYRKSAILLSIAGSLNPTVMAFGLIVIIDYFLSLYNKKRESSVIEIIKSEFLDILKLGICFMPCLLPIIYNKLVLGESPTAMGQFWDTSLFFGRIFAYLFDLNLGFLPYFPLSLITFFVLAIIAVKKKKLSYLLMFIGFLGVIAAYAIKVHINCGMSGISRYGAWSFPIFIFAITSQYDKIISSIKVQNITIFILYVSAIITTFVVVITSTCNHTDMTPIAKYMLDKYPYVYNPLHSSFASRVEHIDGAYNYELPIMYENDNGCVRKILTDSNYDLRNQLIGNLKMDSITEKSFIESFENKKIKHKGEFYFNVPREWKIYVKKVYPQSFEPLVYDNLQEFGEGIYGKENEFCWLAPNANIILNQSNYAKKGMKISFLGHPGLNKKEVTKTIVRINGKKISEVAITENKMYDIIIDENDLPNAKEENYQIDLVTNGFFNPAEMGLSDDNRDLSIQLYYIGNPR